MQLGLDDAGQAGGVHVALAQAQHLGGQREHLAVLRDETQVGQRQQVAAGGGAGQAGAAGDFADGQAGTFLIEGFDHGQAFFQAGDQVAFQRTGADFSFGGGGDHRNGGQVFIVGSSSGHGGEVVVRLTPKSAGRKQVMSKTIGTTL